MFKSNVVYLEVPLEEKDEAKLLGAFYDGGLKKWYFTLSQNNVVNALNYLKFAKWNYPNNSSTPEINLNYVKGVSIKIGKNAGKSLLTAIQNAKNRVYICSPYLGNGPVFRYLDTLKNIKRKLDFKILFSIKDIYESKENLKKFIDFNLYENVEEKETNQLIIKGLEKSAKIFKSLQILYFIITFMGAIYYFFNFKNKNILTIAYAIIFLICIFSINYFLFYKKIKFLKMEQALYSQKDFHYLKFFQKIPRNFVIEDNKEIFPHVKLYIIDDVAFLGSMNLSNKSCFFNIESLIEIRDISAVIELTGFYNKMYDFFYKSSTDSLDFVGNIIYNKEEILKERGIK